MGCVVEHAGHVHEHDTHGHHHWHEHDHGAHDHGHDHASTGTLTRVRHALSHLLGGHSHDSADQIDDALEADATGRRALWMSLALLGVTAVLQAVFVVVTGSVALLGDTFHNVGDALTALPLLAAFHLSRRPATSRFTYGLGRAEDLAGLFVLAMIALSAGLAGWQAVDRLLDPRDVSAPWVLTGVGLIGFVGNELVAQIRIRAGRRVGSSALVADGLHARTDGFTSLGVVLAGLGAVAGWGWVDPVVGLLIAVAILGVLRSAAGQVGRRMLDGVDPELTRRVSDIATATPGVRSVGPVRLRWVGHTLHTRFDVEVDPVLDLVDATAVAHHVEEHLRENIPRLHEASVRPVPASVPV